MRKRTPKPCNAAVSAARPGGVSPPVSTHFSLQYSAFSVTKRHTLAYNVFNQHPQPTKTMPRLVIHPGTPQAWEIQLKPGLNFLGRGSSNDFKIEDGSVSGSHCQIMVEDGGATVKDMGSTNGTFVNSAKVMESPLASGQPLRL